ncbi:primosomal protein N' [Desulfopila sp. IMCC35008]|uniref:replication restart helicase PriA n=1 Tax=Desulfopila sp. IMCC35008 TaxID=2653858 RepID=UPI0013D1ED48|nr:primosomal protein N' [Desulfopila sp. IMCC35008]
MMLLEVAVAAPIGKTLTYKYDDSCLPSGDVKDIVGRRALVPLGRRRITGYILGEAGSVEKGVKVREISCLLDDTPLFHREIIDLFRWTAKYYHYPIGEVIKTALPAGLTPHSVKILSLFEDKHDEFILNIGENLPDWGEKLITVGRLTSSQSQELLTGKKYRKSINDLIEKGVLRIEDSLVLDTVREKRETCYFLKTELPDELTQGEAPDRTNYKKVQKDILHNGSGLKLSEAKTLYYLHRFSTAKGNNRVPRKELVDAYSGASATIPALIENGFVEQVEKRVFRSPLGEQLPYFAKPINLTTGQQQVLEKIIPAIEVKQYAPFLLHGITGSGKTEVYLRAAEKTLDCGRDVLVLVPEIAIATQLEAHFVSRFEEKVVLLHSGLSKSEKYDQYHLALSGSAKIVIGARSAVFAPLKDIGLIVVDEEHDSSLKQDDKLRYNGRDLAIVRAKRCGATVLLGSATPSVISYHNCMTGKYTLLSLPDRVGDRKLPAVTVIDLTKGTPADKKNLFRLPLKNALRENVEKSQQSVILLNRRGFAASVLCKECGQPVQCKNCNVSLTRHQAKQKLICHYCGYDVHEKTVCASCGSTSLVSVGIGTERVEDEVKQLFPEARVARLDTDTAADRKVFLRLIKEMRQGDIDILVGTQMIAKGLHFPGVTLVGVVWADGGLCIPDYRAAEKTFQLITQVTGRAGRGDVPGRVFIQTMRPDHYALQYAREHRYEALVEKELALRSSPLYPPFVRLVTIHISGEDELKVSRCGVDIANTCRQYIASAKLDLELLGPGPAPIDKIKNRFRWQLLLKGANLEHLHRLCSFIQGTNREICSAGCKIALDVDPENMM